MRVVTCRHPDGPAHDCAYVEARNKLIEDAIPLAYRACAADPDWEVARAKLGVTEEEAAERENLRNEIVSEKFHAAMDWLAEKRGISRSTRQHDPRDVAAFEHRKAPAEVEADDLPDDDELAGDVKLCCPHRGADHQGNAAPAPGARCSICGDECPGWIPRRGTALRGVGVH